VWFGWIVVANPLTGWWGKNKKKVIGGGVALVVIWGFVAANGNPKTTDELIPDRLASKGRELRVHADKKAKDPMPLVLVLHDDNTSATSVENDSKVASLADRKHFAVAFPEAVGGTWRVDGQGPDAQYLRDVVTYVSQDWTAIDPARVYIWGFGEGARMALAVACAGPTEFAAIGVVGQFDPEPGPTCRDRVPEARVAEPSWDNKVTDSLWKFSAKITRIGG
jgi:polyhydroxybutyrate depolymerase